MITYNDTTFFKDGKIWFPVMGEFQYSRCDKRFWNSGIAKMKALGIDTVASYSFWIHHEEIEGQFDFDGNKNLRDFLQLVKENNMLFCLRIGPWVHGECRNGGFPDWIYNKGYNLRSNDPQYMAKVERYFKELYKQCKGYLYSDGGPLFSIQIENEYSQWGKQGKDIGDNHINALMDMLKKIGFDVPVYFATGWGKAAVGKCVPVWGCYSEAPWENSKDELPPQEGYLITNNPNDSNIGSDTGKKEMDLDISKSKFPYATVEIGSGIQVTLTRRPVIKGVDAENLVLCKLASGVAAIGYYVFHGGMNPVGKLSTMQEYLIPGRNEGGFNCDLPVINYDFQGAISQYGVMTDLGKHLKLYNYFAKEFGYLLAPMKTYLPDDNAIKEDDLNSLRYSVRYDGNSGFVFINNFVRHYNLPSRDIKDFNINVFGKPFVTFDLKIKNGDSCIYPVNMKTEKGLIKFISATPLCTLDDGTYVFWKNDDEVVIDADDIVKDNIIILSKQDAVNSFKFNKDNKDYLFITDGGMYMDKDGIHIEYNKDLTLKVYPDYTMPDSFTKEGSDGKFSVYTLKHNNNNIDVKIDYNENKSENDYKVYDITLSDNVTEKEQIYFDYSGNKLEVYLDDKLIADDYFTGLPYMIATKNHGKIKKMTIRVYKLMENQFVYIEKPQKFIDGVCCELNNITTKTMMTIDI